MTEPSEQTHNDLGVPLARLVAGQHVLLNDEHKPVVGRIVRMDRPRLGVVEVRPEHGQGEPYRAMFHAENVVDLIDRAMLHNRGAAGWELRIEAGTVARHIPNLTIGEDESPRDAAVREIRAVGFVVDGDGSWWVGAYTGPGADWTWAVLVPADADPGRRDV